MKQTQYIQFVVVFGLVFLLGSISQAWNSHPQKRHHSYDNRHDHHLKKHIRGYSSPYRSSPHTKKYRYPYRPRHGDQYTMQDGWDLLRKDRSHTALDIFRQLAHVYPKDGAPKLGYAIAAADAGWMSKGVWAMRRAFYYDPDAANRLELDPRIERKVKRLASKYRSRSHGLPEKDAWFMQASLYYLLSDREACLAAIERSRKTRDSSSSTRNLYRMAEEYL